MPLGTGMVGMAVDGMVTSWVVPVWSGLTWALTLTPRDGVTAGVSAEVPILSLFTAL